MPTPEFRPTNEVGITGISTCFVDLRPWSNFFWISYTEGWLSCWQSNLIITLCAGHSLRVSFVTWPWPSTQNGCSTVHPVYSGERCAHHDICGFGREKGCGADRSQKHLWKPFHSVGFWLLTPICAEKMAHWMHMHLLLANARKRL